MFLYAYDVILVQQGVGGIVVVFNTVNIVRSYAYRLLPASTVAL